MTQDIKDLERDVEETRARLDHTIDRLQDKLSVSGVVDDLLGSARHNSYASFFDDAMTVIRRNPIPVMLVAAGVGWLIHRATSQDRTVLRSMPYDPLAPELAHAPRMNDDVEHEPLRAAPETYEPPLSDPLTPRPPVNARI